MISFSFLCSPLQVSPAPIPALSAAFSASAGRLHAEDRFLMLFAALWSNVAGEAAVTMCGTQ